MPIVAVGPRSQLYPPASPVFLALLALAVGSVWIAVKTDAWRW